MTLQGKNPYLIGTIFMIGLVILVVESMKSPEQTVRRNAEQREISVETAIGNQSASAKASADEQATGISEFSCTSGQCTSTKGISAEPTAAPKVVPAPSSISFPDRVKAKQTRFERAKEIADPHGFINLPEGKMNLTLTELVGKKVILVDFWTYSCINCQRTTPYLNAWYKKYKDQGLEIVGIHTPEFSFEKDITNVTEATRRMGITYPVVLDNAYATWTAYRNRFWPRKYLVDIDGFIVYDHIGEGAYDVTENQIQLALAERALVLGVDETIAKGVVQPELSDAPSSGAVSPETYFGALRNAFLANGTQGTIGEQKLSLTGAVQLGGLYLDGTWDFGEEHAENRTAGAKIVYRYRAKNVYMVASSPLPVRVRVIRDGAPVSSEAGEDVQGDYVTVQADRLYKLINESSQGEHTLELIIESPGLKAFTFTFG